MTWRQPLPRRSPALVSTSAHFGGSLLTQSIGARKPKLDNDIDVPSPQTIENVKLFMAPDEEMKANIEYAI